MGEIPETFQWPFMLPDFVMYWITTAAFPHVFRLDILCRINVPFKYNRGCRQSLLYIIIINYERILQLILLYLRTGFSVHSENKVFIRMVVLKRKPKNTSICKPVQWHYALEWLSDQLCDQQSVRATYLIVLGVSSLAVPFEDPDPLRRIHWRKEMETRNWTHLAVILSAKGESNMLCLQFICHPPEKVTVEMAQANVTWERRRMIAPQPPCFSFMCSVQFNEALTTHKIRLDVIISISTSDDILCTQMILQTCNKCRARTIASRIQGTGPVCSDCCRMNYTSTQPSGKKVREST